MFFYLSLSLSLSHYSLAVIIHGNGSASASHYLFYLSFNLFVLAKANAERFFSVLFAVNIVSQFILSNGLNGDVAGECVCVCDFLCCLKIERTLTTKLVASLPQKWHAIAIRMNDLSFQLDLMYAVCSIVRFSLYLFFYSLYLARYTREPVDIIFTGVFNTTTTQ